MTRKAYLCTKPQKYQIDGKMRLLSAGDEVNPDWMSHAQLMRLVRTNYLKEVELPDKKEVEIVKSKPRRNTDRSSKE